MRFLALVLVAVAGAAVSGRGPAVASRSGVSHSPATAVVALEHGGTAGAGRAGQGLGDERSASRSETELPEVMYEQADAGSQAVPHGGGLEEGHAPKHAGALTVLSGLTDPEQLLLMGTILFGAAGLCILRAAKVKRSGEVRTPEASPMLA